jgi:hypothetical protein
MIAVLGLNTRDMALNDKAYRKKVGRSRRGNLG